MKSWLEEIHTTDIYLKGTNFESSIEDIEYSKQVQ